MKKPAIAAAMSCIVPGAGLWYLGKRVYAAVNLVLAVLVPLSLAFWAPQSFVDSLHYVLLVIAAGSAGAAHAVAAQMQRGDRESH